jgi:hypothetical protein
MQIARDTQNIVRCRFNNNLHLPLLFWDDAFGPLWVYREAIGVKGIVRAEAYEQAWQCVVDEIMQDADPNDPDNRPDAYGNLPEGVHYRGSGVPSNEGLNSHLALEDLNGSWLGELTLDLMDELEIEIVLEEKDPAWRVTRTWWVSNVLVMAEKDPEHDPLVEIFVEDTPEMFRLSDRGQMPVSEDAGGKGLSKWVHETLEYVAAEIAAWRKEKNHE